MYIYLHGWLIFMAYVGEIYQSHGFYGIDWWEGAYQRLLDVSVLSGFDVFPLQDFMSQKNPSKSLHLSVFISHNWKEVTF